MATMMQCNHAANGVVAMTNAPVCVICAPAPAAYQVADPDESGRALKGRLMRCTYPRGRDGRVCAGRTPRPSDENAAFFHHEPKEEFDSFYDGCWGWD